MIIIKFINGQIINGDQWENLPNIPIMKLAYKLPTGKFVVMSGFESYYCLIERYRIVYGGKGDFLNTINFLGRYKDKVYQFTLHRKGKTFQRVGIWDIDEFRPVIIKPLPRINPKEKRYTIDFGIPQKTNHDLWKWGVPSINPTTEIKTHLLDL